MTDVPADSGAPGAEPDAPSEPPVVRRSNYAPPPPGAEPPIFDDDALADAMAAEVRAYTQPITLPKQRPTPEVSGAESNLQPPIASSEAAPPEALPVEAAPPEAPTVPTEPASSSAEQPTDDELFRSLGSASTGSASTLEAIERLENQLRLLSSGEIPTVDLAFAEAAPPVATPPAAPPETPAEPPQTEREPEPALDHPAPGHFFPAAFEPIAPQASPEGAAIASDADDWLASTDSTAGESDSTGPAEDPPRSPLLPDVDESLIDPAAAAELNTSPVSANEVLKPLPGTTGEHPWWATSEPVDGAWDLATPASPEPPVDEPTASEPAAEEPPVPVPPAAEPAEPEAPARELPEPEPAAVVVPVEPAPVEPAPVEPARVEPAPVEPAPVATVVMESRESAAPVLDEWESIEPAPVPFSTEPPVGPETPDWLDAPPPTFEPPELVEPPVFADSPSDLGPDAGSEVSPDAGSDADSNADSQAPMTESTMAQLPKPLPTGLPKLEDRAELPPPPGYDDIPIMEGAADASPPPVAPPSFFPVGPPPTAAPHRPEAEVAPEAMALPEAMAVPEATEMSALDHDEDDVIDEVDRVAGTGAVPISSAGMIEPLAPPSEPIATIRLSEGEPAMVDKKAQQLSAFEVESAGPEPTAPDLRAGRAARLFWLWFAANSSVLSLGLGAVLLGTGMSLRQAIVATLAGVAISFLPLGLGTLAGKWSGQPTMIVSRAAFGHVGNILPALLAIATRVLWGGVLLWLLATAVAQVLVGAGLDAGLGTTIWQLVGLVAGFVIATVVAVLGYGFVAKLQLVLSILSALLILGAAVLTYQHLDFMKALTVPDGSWILVISGAALVFSVVGLAWVHSSSDLARYQRPASNGGSSMLWATFGATLPPFALIAWGAMLAASDPALAKGLTTNPLAAIATLLPAWYPAPLLAAAALGLLSGAVLTMYSGGFALQALGVRVRRSFGTFIAAILVLATAAALIFAVTDFSSLVRDLVITVAVPVAAWAGIFAAEMMIRTRRFHTASLLSPGGLYPQVRWLNLLALIVISGVGLGLVNSNIPVLHWEGFLYGILGVGPRDLLASSDVGVFVALLLGILVPLAGGVPTIRRQELIDPAGAATAPAQARS